MTEQKTFWVWFGVGFIVLPVVQALGIICFRSSGFVPLLLLSSWGLPILLGGLLIQGKITNLSARGFLWGGLLSSVIALIGIMVMGVLMLQGLS